MTVDLPSIAAKLNALLPPDVLYRRLIAVLRARAASIAQEG